MSRIEGTIVVPAPLARVFEYASDWRRWPEWFEGVSRFEPVTSVIRGNGARFTYQARILGISIGVETEIRDFVEGRGWRGVGPQGTTEWKFEAIDEQTRFSYSLEYRLPVPIVGPLIDAWLLRRQWRGLVQRSLANLRRHFEKPREGGARVDSPGQM